VIVNCPSLRADTYRPDLALAAFAVFGISTITVDRLTKRGLLRPSRATRRPLFPVWEIERFLRDSCLSLGKDK